MPIFNLVLPSRAIMVALAVGLFLLGVGLGATGAWSISRSLAHAAMNAPLVEAAAEVSDTEAPVDRDHVNLPRDSWPVAGMTIEPAKRDSLPETVQLTGKIALNADRVAHIYPLVEGRVEQVLVKFGQRVKQGDVLVIVQSKEIGQAKLALYQDRLARDFAAHKNEWTQTIAKNTGELIKTLRQGTAITEVEATFRDRPMGENRERLLGSYVTYHKSQAEFDRLSRLAKEGLTPGKQLAAAEAQRDVDHTTLQSTLESIGYEAEHERILAEHALKEAETRVSVDETNLAIMGYAAADCEKIDPAREGEKLSHYPIRAPFDGTILSKDVVLLERVSPEQQVLSIADLSTVWVTADIFDQHLPLLREWSGRKIAVRSEVWGTRTFEADVFSTGEVVDDASRTVVMRAQADNREGFLKPGMFVTLELPKSENQPTLQIPLSSVQEHEGRPFVFVYLGGDAFERRNVVLGRRNHDVVELKQGVNEGEKVATNGGFALKSRMLADLMAGD